MTTRANRFATFLHRKITGVHPPEGFLPALTTLISILGIGTVFYHLNEGWTYIDSIYFSTMTVTTVGYGDFHPTNDVSKIFTMFLVLFGAGLGIYIISTFAASLMEGRQRRVNKLEQLIKKVTE